MDQAVLTDTDLRGFLQRHEEVGELQRIDAEVDLQLTVGAISQRLAERAVRLFTSKTCAELVTA